MFSKFVTGKLHQVFGKGKKVVAAAGLAAGLLAVVACQGGAPADTTEPTTTLRPLGSEVIGEWESEPNEYISGKLRITIFSEAGQLNLKYNFYDGSELIQPLVESNSSAGRRFDLAGGGIEYFVIDADGNLQIYGSIGLLFTARKLE